MARAPAAAGSSGGRAPLEAEMYVPDFLRFDRAELGALLAQIRYPLATHVYFLILAHGGFENGEFLGGYARLMALCTPPGPDKGTGNRLAGPTYKQVRKAVDLLVDKHLLRRNATANENQGQLRLKAYPRKTPKAASR